MFNRNVSPSLWVNTKITLCTIWTVVTAGDFWRLVVRDLIRGKTWPMEVHYNTAWVPEPIVAICLGRHVFAWRSALSQWVRDHEEQHVRQYAEYGFFGYLARWFHQTWTVGYAQNVYELEADAWANAEANARWAAFADEYDGWYPLWARETVAAGDSRMRDADGFLTEDDPEPGRPRGYRWPE